MNNDRFAGQRDIASQHGPGVIQAIYDFCPTGNEADLASTTMTAVGLGNPLRLGAIPYDDLTKDYFGGNGRVWEDYSGTGTQTPAFANGDCVAGTALAEGGRRQAGSPGTIPQYMPNTGGGGEAESSPCVDWNSLTVVEGVGAIAGGVVMIGEALPALASVEASPWAFVKIGVGMLGINTGVAMIEHSCGEA